MGLGQELGYTPPGTSRHRLDEDSADSSSEEPLEPAIGEVTCSQEQYLNMLGSLKTLEDQVKLLQSRGETVALPLPPQPPDVRSAVDEAASQPARSARDKVKTIRGRFAPKAAELGNQVADAAGAAAGVARQGLATTASGVAKTGFVQELVLAADKANLSFAMVSKSMAGLGLGVKRAPAPPAPPVAPSVRPAGGSTFGHVPEWGAAA